ncbi:calcium-binding protein [uncultured Propionivibrio sp.]|uniref:calcium-binding protein n=1 Tax=uncultured Propionivibrio sp. TaxID=426737 RepID=UPI0029C0D099|nr:calcium-binding protein [uncultured Propionivibrio sp.]
MGDTHLNALLNGDSGDNLLCGSAGNDTLDGGAGTDLLIGGAGNDTYRFGLGDGADTVQENDATPGKLDTIEFLAGIDADQIWLRQAGNDLTLSVIGTTDTLTIQNWYEGNEHRVEQFRTADGKRLLDGQVEQLVQAMAAFAPPEAGQTALPTPCRDSLAPVIAANWH